MATPTVGQFLKNKVLWRVYLMWFFRRIVPLMAIQIILLVVALRVFAAKVFVGKVLENAAIAADANLWEFFTYLLNAFLQTHIIVQVAVLVGLGLGALVIRDAGRMIGAYIGTFKGRNQVE